MPSVRCPTCKRLLNVRDEMIGLDAKCPLCAAVFPAEPEGGRPAPYQPLPDAPDPTRPWRPAGRRDEEPIPKFPGPRRDGHELPPSPLRRAGNWMFGLALTALVWNMTCGCAGVLTLVGRANRARDLDAFIVASAFMLQLVFLMLILIAGNQMRTGGRNRGLIWTGVVLAICEALFLAGRGVMVLAALDSPRVAEATVGFNCVSLVISAALFISGLWAMRVLNSPEGKPPEPNED
jgi:hypothetical protein